MNLGPSSSLEQISISCFEDRGVGKVVILDGVRNLSSGYRPNKTSARHGRAGAGRWAGIPRERNVTIAITRCWFRNEGIMPGKRMEVHTDVRRFGV